MIRRLKVQEQEIADAEEGGDYAPKADAENTEQARVQKQQMQDYGDSDYTGPVNAYDRTVHLANGTRTFENGVKLTYPNWQPEEPYDQLGSLS